MPKPFDLLARQFTDIASEYAKSSDNHRRRELLLAMRLILDEADSLTRTHLQGVVPEPPAPREE